MILLMTTLLSLYVTVFLQGPPGEPVSYFYIHTN